MTDFSCDRCSMGKRDMLEMNEASGVTSTNPPLTDNPHVGGAGMADEANIAIPSQNAIGTSVNTWVRVGDIAARLVKAAADKRGGRA